MFRTALPFAVLAMLSMVACSDYIIEDGDLHGDPSKNKAAIEVTPELLNFQQINAGQLLTLPVTITSIGEDTLYLEDLFIEGPMSFELDDTATERILAPGSQTTLPVTYTPMADEDASGLLHILSNDRDAPDVTVELAAIGLAPMIELSPSTWDFGDHEIGCEQEQPITVRNIGSAPLTIYEVVFSPTSDELVSSHYFNDGIVLAPDQTETITVYYEPRDELPDTGYLHVYSNDPAHPDALATQYGQAHLADEVMDEYEQEGNNWTDILWVVDNSGSMGNDQASLATNFSAFLDIVDVLDIDYHLGVVTTDDSSLQGAIPIMTPSTPDVHAAFAAAVTVGTTGSGNEKGFQYGWGALSSPMTDPGGPNDGFLREEAGLRVVFVSDEAEQSSGTVTDYVTNFQSLKVNSDHVVLSCIIQQNYGQRYEQAATMTGGLVEYLTNPNWINTLSQLAWLSMSWQDTFELSQVPVEETIEVELNHVPVYVGWYFDGIYNAVVFEPDYIPDTGDLITITYNLLGTCEG